MMTHEELQFAGRVMSRWAKATAILYPLLAPLTVWHQLREGGPMLAAVLSGLVGPIAISGALFMVFWFLVVVAMLLGWEPKR